MTDIPIAAGRTAYSAGDIFELCRSRAAGVIAPGLHETRGVVRCRQAAARAAADISGKSGQGMRNIGRLKGCDLLAGQFQRKRGHGIIEMV